jgi:hypothetical protein
VVSPSERAALERWAFSLQPHRTETFTYGRRLPRAHGNLLAGEESRPCDCP